MVGIYPGQIWDIILKDTTLNAIIPNAETQEDQNPRKYDSRKKEKRFLEDIYLNVFKSEIIQII